MKVKIYIINLENSIDRFQAVQSSLQGTSYPVERVIGMDGRKLSDAEFKDLTRINRFSRPLIRTEVGCYLSHRRCLQKIISEQIDFGIVFEDDAVAPPDFESIVSRVLAERVQQPGGWEILKLSDCSNNFVEKQKIGQHTLVECYPVPTRALAQIWTRTAAERFLAAYPHIARPVDIDLKFLWEHHIRIENIRPNVIHHPPIASTIGDRAHLKKPFFKRTCYQWGSILQRILWSIRSRGFIQTWKLERNT